ncbi:MAG: ABC transporter ATP-binding protein [Desulfuromonadaceae bacterium]|nr:ABC transporter ATP-binding protein [Desulfuromonadaceae bacterium]
MPHSCCLQIRNLSTYFFTKPLIKAVRELDLELHSGRTLALVGESGCGKSMTALSILRLVPPPGRTVSGQILLGSEDLLSLRQEEMQRIRGNRIAMIFQDPMTALNPVFTVGSQIIEVLRLHLGLTQLQARDRAAELLHQVGMAAPHQRLSDYPHQLSGGMRQRAMIAMALACDPDILIADEPTTALDVTIQAQIMALLSSLQQQRNMSLLLISHDLGIVAQHADQVAMMYDGMIVEQADTLALFDDPQHPYTRHLLTCIPGRRSANRPHAHIHSSEDFWQQCPEAYRPLPTRLPPLQSVRTDHQVRRWS